MKKLVAGDKAPSFSVQDVSGKAISLDAFKDGYVLVAFLRYAGCPWCNLTVHRLALEYKILKKQKCEVVAFVQSTDEKIQKNIIDRHDVKPAFPLIAAPNSSLYKSYGVSSSIKSVGKMFFDAPFWVQAIKKHGFKQTKVDGNLFLAPAVFLINAKTKKIVTAQYNASFYEHKSFTSIYEHTSFGTI